MTKSYWNTQSDPYQYPASPVLKNLPDIRNADTLAAFEQRATALRLDEMLAAISSIPINLEMWQTIHRILFQDVYDWAGQIRAVQIAKGNTVFAMPEHIGTEAKRIFDQLSGENLTALPHNQFILKLAYYFGELNALHPFREGNGRTQKLLFDEISRRQNYTIDWMKMDVDVLLQAVITAFHKQDYTPLQQLFSAACLAKI
jgi:cell filamentation protein